MSIMRLRKIFNRPVRMRIGKRSISLGSPLVVIFWGIVVIFVIGAYTTFSGSPQQQRAGPQEREVSKLVCQVGGFKIPRRQFEQRLALMVKNQPTKIDIPELAYIKTSLLDGMIQRHLMLEAARAEGVKVSGQEITGEQDQLVDSAISRRFPDQKDLRNFLQQQQISYEQYRQKVREDYYGDKDVIREDLLVRRLEDLIKGRVTVTDEQVKENYTEVKPQHILISPDSFLNPPAEKEPTDAEAEAQPPLSLTKEQAEAKAQQKAEQLLQQIKEGADFAQLAKENSECPSAEKGGDLGWVRRGQMVKEFEQAAFALEVGQISNIVKTDYGFHIIKVTDRRSNLPDDFEENKDNYKQQVLTRRQEQAWGEYQDSLEKEANIQIFDPELKANKLLEKGNKNEAMSLLAEAAENDPFNMSARYQLAQLCRQAGENAAAVKYLQQIAEDSEGASSAQVHLELGELLNEQGMTEEALAEFTSASDWAAAPQYGNYYIHTRLKTIFQDMEKPDLVKQEDEWMAEFRQQQNIGPTRPGTVTLPGD